MPPSCVYSFLQPQLCAVPVSLQCMAYLAFSSSPIHFRSNYSRHPFLLKQFHKQFTLHCQHQTTDDLSPLAFAHKVLNSTSNLRLAYLRQWQESFTKKQSRLYNNIFPWSTNRSTTLPRFDILSFHSHLETCIFLVSFPHCVSIDSVHKHFLRSRLLRQERTLFTSASLVATQSS